MGSYSRSHYLFGKSSALFGAARILDLGGTFNSYNTSRTPQEADARAIFGDWLTVGGDLRTAAEAESDPEKLHRLQSEK